MIQPTRRTFMTGTLAAALGAGLAACATSPGGDVSTELSDGPVTLVFNWWGADDRNALTREALAVFMEDHPNITVKTAFSDFPGYWTKLATATAAKDMPDVMQFDELYLASYADRGTLLDLSTMEEVLDTSDLSPEILGTGEVKDTLYAVPTGGAANALIINTTILADAGLELPDTKTWTWQEFSDFAAQVTQATGSEAFGVEPFGGDAFTLQVLARQQGHDLYDEEGKIVIPPEVVADYFQRQLDLIEAGAAPSVKTMADSAGVALDQTLIATGKVAMNFIPAGFFTSIQAAAPQFDYTLGDWPTIEGGKEDANYLKPVMYWAASSMTEHPAEAALLVDFLVNDERAAKILGDSRGIPANPKLRSVIEPELDDTGKELLAFTELMDGRVGDPPPITPNGASGVGDILTRYNQQVRFGQAEPLAAAKGFIDELQKSVTAAG